MESEAVPQHPRSQGPLAHRCSGGTKWAGSAEESREGECGEASGANPEGNPNWRYRLKEGSVGTGR